MLHSTFELGAPLESCPANLGHKPGCNLLGFAVNLADNVRFRFRLDLTQKLVGSSESDPVCKDPVAS